MAMIEERQSAAVPRDGAFCPVFHAAIELIGKRWTGAIVRAIASGVTRFSDLSAVIPELSDRMLSERLKELEAAGLVVRTVLPTTPVRVEYRLLPKGEALMPVFAAISQWAAEWYGDPGAGHGSDAGPESRALPVSCAGKCGESR